MSDDSLIQAMPDVVAFVRPDGLITHHLGGRQVPFIRDSGSLAGRRLGDVLQPHISTLIARLTQRALATRGGCEAEFSVDGVNYQARLSAQGPRRALCVIRCIAESARQVVAPDTEPGPEGSERRGFVRRFQQSVALAVLSERPLALCLIHLGGLDDIGRYIDISIGEQILAKVLDDLPADAVVPDSTAWYVGKVGDGLLGVVIEGSTEREPIRTVVETLCRAISRPLQIRDATFYIKVAAGVAILGHDANQPAELFDHARTAMLESRRSGAESVHFYSDSLRMLPVARLDIERELRKAIEADQIGLRYATRHELATGRITGVQAYMRWVHPLQGEMPPSQFLPIADATGLALAVSRAALERLARDLGALRAALGASVAVSFGALRQHVSSGQLGRDCVQRIPPVEFSAGRFELRIAERTFATLNRPERALSAIVGAGARVVVDELGRGFSSLARLSQCPLWALQIDRALVVSAHDSPAALRACRGIAALARALDIRSIAAGVDDEPARARMLEAGCTEGFGDYYPVEFEQTTAAESARAAG